MFSLCLVVRWLLHGSDLLEVGPSFRSCLAQIDNSHGPAALSTPASLALFKTETELVYTPANTTTTKLGPTNNYDRATASDGLRATTAWKW